jgi:hypothetical protein
LQHGARADDCRRGHQAAEPRARLPGGGTHAHCEPDKVYLDAITKDVVAIDNDVAKINADAKLKAAMDRD